jgi:hypothetical protein
VVETDYLALTQGPDEYVSVSVDDWLAALPDYGGLLVGDSWNPGTIKKKDFAHEGEELSRAVALVKKDKQAKRDDPYYKLWEKAKLTVPTAVYNLNETVYGYAYGVVYKGKLVGYIVAGASSKAPPVVEYSLNPAKYLALTGADKAYFGRTSGFLLAKGSRVSDLYADAPGQSVSSLAAMAAGNEPDRSAQADLDAQWTDLQTEVSSAVLLGSVGVKTYVGIDTCDYCYYNICSTTTMAMFVDAYARRIEPGFFEPNISYPRPHSKGLNDYFHGIYPRPSPSEITSVIRTYFTNKKLSSYLTFNTWIKDQFGSVPVSKAEIWQAHVATINSSRVDMVGYVYQQNQGHIMLGVGYTSDQFFICRDTLTNDNSPFSEYELNSAAYTYYVIGSTPTNAQSSTAWGSVVLQQGSNNFNVRRLECCLKALFYFSGTPDNLFDATTKAAVQAFQSDNGLTADGIVGSGTYAKLKVAHIMRYDNRTGTWRVLSSGKKGDDVAQLQFRLNDIGYNAGTVDGSSAARRGPLSRHSRTITA